MSFFLSLAFSLESLLTSLLSIVTRPHKQGPRLLLCVKDMASFVAADLILSQSRYTTCRRFSPKTYSLARFCPNIHAACYDSLDTHPLPCVALHQSRHRDDFLILRGVTLNDNTKSGERASR